MTSKHRRRDSTSRDARAPRENKKRPATHADPVFGTPVSAAEVAAIEPLLARWHDTPPDAAIAARIFRKVGIRRRGRFSAVAVAAIFAVGLATGLMGSLYEGLRALGNTRVNNLLM
jgi:hypothetical protein